MTHVLIRTGSLAAAAGDVLRVEGQFVVGRSVVERRLDTTRYVIVVLAGPASGVFRQGVHGRLSLDAGGILAGDLPAQGKLLRIGVKTKGCSGMSYDMSWTDEAAPTDEVVNDKGLTVLVDRKASLFLIGTVMDYEVKNLTAGFTFTNPNEKGRCGCGESFHV